MYLNLKFYQEEEENLVNKRDTVVENYVLNWYPFKGESSILEIGGNAGKFTELLSKKATRVVTIENNLENAKNIAKEHENIENVEIIVGNLKDIKLEEKFDYILLIGTLPYVATKEQNTSKEILRRLGNLLKEDGKILLCVDNRFGIKYFVGNPENYLNKKFVGLLNYNNEEEKIETYTKQKLINLLEETGYKYKNFYYPLPDYRVPNVIFSDKSLPKYNTIDKYTPYPVENADILVNEIDLFREILKADENMFTFFANAYFVEASKKVFNAKYEYISFNNMRKSKYRLITKITPEYVEKEVVSDEAIKHYEQIKENISLLNKENINMLDSVQNEKIVSTYINQENMLSNVLTKKLEEGNKDEVYFIIDKFYDKIKKSSEVLKNSEKTIFDENDIIITKEEKDKLHFLENGFWDMTFKNCFYIENELYFFDQEWKEKNIPAEYVLYRSFVYTISLRRFVNIEELIRKYELEEFLEIFKLLDVKLQEKIRDEEVWEFYNQKHYFDIDATKQEMQNMKIREEAKDKAIENLQKQIQELQNQKISTFVKRKIKRIVGRKENE